MKQLLLVRHGQSQGNAMRRLQGQADSPLSETGQVQAEMLLPMIRSLEPDRAMSSDLARARDTAAILGHADAALDPDWREIDVGDWSDRPIADITAADPSAYRGWRAGTHTPPGGESWPHFRDRIRAALERLVDGEGRRPLVVCHGGVIRAACEILLGLPPSKILPVAPASLTVMTVEPRRSELKARLQAFNLTPGRLVLDAPD